MLSLIVIASYRVPSIDFRVLKKHGQERVLCSSGTVLPHGSNDVTCRIIHHRLTNCHDNRVIQFPVCPPLALKLSLIAIYRCVAAPMPSVIDEIPRRRPIKWPYGRGFTASRVTTVLSLSLAIDNRGMRRRFLRKTSNLSESRDAYVITRPPVCKKESGQSLNRVFSFFVRIYA